VSGDELILTPSRRKHLILLAGAALFVAIGVMILSERRVRAADAWMAYTGIGFFGLCGLVCAAQLIPGCSYLKIRRDGFEFRALWRGGAWRWSDVEEFGVARFTAHRLVGFRFSPSYDRRRLARVRRLNAAMLGYEAALPDNYGMKYDELAALLNRKRAEYGGQA
jgi:hypothetical protein